MSPRPGLRPGPRRSTRRLVPALPALPALLAAAALATAAPASAAPTSAAAASTTQAPATPPVRSAQPLASLPIDSSAVFPEGVATGAGRVFAGSNADGTVYAAPLPGPGRARTPQRLEPFLPGGADGRTSTTGIKVSGQRLLVAGAATGRLFVYDLPTRALVASYQVPDPASPTFLNDIAVTPSGDAWVTDSQRAVLYRVPAAEVQGPVTGEQRPLQVGADLSSVAPVQPGFNGNGVVTSPDGTALVVVYSNSGALVRYDLASGAVGLVDAGGFAVTDGDGLVRDGSRLYAVQNQQAVVDRLDLSRDGRRARLVSRTTYAGTRYPTTAALLPGHRLVLTNSQFDVRGTSTPPAPFTLSVDRER